MLNNEEQSFCETESFQSMQFIEPKPKFSNKWYGWYKLKIGKIFILISVLIFVGVLLWYQTTINDELTAKLQKQEENFFNQSELLKTLKTGIKNQGYHIKNLSKELSDIQLDQDGQANEIKDTKVILENHQQSLDNHAGRLDNHVGKLDFHYRASSAEDCDELLEHGINVSGTFNIDPDGRYYGMHSFEVICDFEKKTTSIKPKKKLIRASKSSKAVQYSASMDQIRYLIEHSGSCYQEVSVQDVSLQDVVWLDFKGRERKFSDRFENKVQLRNFWLLPITGVAFKKSGNTSVVNIGDITCSQKIHVNISGSLYDAIPDLKPKVWPGQERQHRSFSWKPRRVPVTFNIEFDIEVLEWKSNTYCYPLIFFSVGEFTENDELVCVPGIRYCAYYQKLRVEHFNQYAFEGSPKTTTEIDLSSSISKKPKHVQVKQFIPHGSTKFYYVKYGHKVLYSGETKNVWSHKDELYISIFSLYENDGARVTNLMITE